jgi:hypothetical protein
MKTLAAGSAAILLLATLVFAAPKPKTQTFTGEIMDSQCAMNGSHAEMLKKKRNGRQGSERSHGKSDVCQELCQDGRQIRPIRFGFEEGLSTRRRFIN